MAQSALSVILLTLTLFLFILQLIQAQSPTAPAPSPPGPINITDILAKAGQFNTFNKFLDDTQVGNQINTQVNNSHDGMTVFAPTDNAFQNLPSGTLNGLSDQQKVQLCLYHVTPKFYSPQDLQTVSNPVRTQATGQDGGIFGLNFTGSPNQNQINVSTGVVTTTIYNEVWKSFPLAIYQVDRVLLPAEFYGNKASSPASSPPTLNATSSGSGSGRSSDKGPSPSPNDSRKMTVGFGLISGLWLLCIGLLS